MFELYTYETNLLYKRTYFQLKWTCSQTIRILVARKKTRVSRIGAKWHLGYRKEILEPKEVLKKGENKPKPSTTEPKKKLAKRNVLQTPKSTLTKRKLRVYQGRR